MTAAPSLALALTVAPWLALAWLWFGGPAPWAAVAAATLAFAGAAHGLGRAIGRWLDVDDGGDAPAALAIGRGAAVYALAAGALARLGVDVGAAADAVVLAGLVAGTGWAVTRGRAPVSDEPPAALRATGAWSGRLVAGALAALAIAAAAEGGGLAATAALSPALAALADAVAGAAAHPLHAALVDDGWAFALTLALALTAARGGALGRVLLVLAIASVPVVAPASVRWLAAAWTLTALLTVTRAGRRWRAAPVLALLVAAIATMPPTEPRATLVGVAIGLAAWALGCALTDRGADDALAGRGPTRGLAATAAALAIALAIASARVPVGRPPTSWQDRLDRRLDDAAALVGAERATL